MIPDRLTPEDLASIRRIANTCDAPPDRAIGNLIRSLANDVEQWQDAAADIWDEGYEAGEFFEHNYGSDSEADYPDNPYRNERA